EQAKHINGFKDVIAHDPATCSITPGRETLIEIDKNGQGLGISLVGGSDTILGSTVIHEIYADGAAAKDGRLQPGDQLFQVNGHSLRNVTHKVAISFLRQTPTKVRLVVFRDPEMITNLMSPGLIYDIFDVELNKKPGRGLGLSIVGRKHEPGVFVSEIVKGGVADADGRLMPGDQLLAVNGNDISKAYREEAAALMKTTMGAVKLKIGRLKGTSPSSKEFQQRGVASSMNQQKVVPQSESSDSKISPPNHVIVNFLLKFSGKKPSSEHTGPPNDIINVELNKTPEEPWGMGIGKRTKGIYITSIMPNSAVVGKLVQPTSQYIPLVLICHVRRH
ncbi:unnamed protein product, partial [Soboliphyme baturini]|uniref:PDZ domain-containing protein n=1 Tax=Soboliphyme baturini TaxID=241478 RepID=A0A183IDP8_9BILA